MSSITVEYYGHSCFRIVYDNDSIVLDPYENGSVPGWQMPDDLKAHRTFCSHEHADHNAAHLVKKEEGSDAMQVSSFTVPHDDAYGTKRGMTKVTVIQAGSCHIVHMGDYGRLPTLDEYAALRNTDVMLIPAGGYFTIDADQAREIIDHIAPKLTILMHYRNGIYGYTETEDLKEIKKTFPMLECLNETSLTFDETSVPRGIVTLKGIQ